MKKGVQFENKSNSNINWKVKKKKKHFRLVVQQKKTIVCLMIITVECVVLTFHSRCWE